MDAATFQTFFADTTRAAYLSRNKRRDETPPRSAVKASHLTEFSRAFLARENFSNTPLTTIQPVVY
jgi:hypothetical protein